MQACLWICRSWRR